MQAKGDPRLILTIPRATAGDSHVLTAPGVGFSHNFLWPGGWGFELKKFRTVLKEKCRNFSICFKETGISLKSRCCVVLCCVVLCCVVLCCVVLCCVVLCCVVLCCVVLCCAVLLCCVVLFHINFCKTVDVYCIFNNMDYFRSFRSF